MDDAVDRAMVFVDGSNIYHRLVDKGFQHPNHLDWCKVSRKLCGPRKWIQTRYYVGALREKHENFQVQQQLFKRLLRQKNIVIKTGRMEARKQKNALRNDLLEVIGSYEDSMPPELKTELSELAAAHADQWTLKEKEVDVAIAVDLCRLAVENAYDTAYLISADGDFKPALEFIVVQGKIAFGMSPQNSSALRAPCKAFIVPDINWFDDCLVDD